MNTIRREQVLLLLDQPQSPCVSLYARFHPTNLEGKGDLLRWEQLVNQASEQLNQQGVPHQKVTELLAPARTLPNTKHWRERKQSLAMFSSASLQEIYHFSGECQDEAWGDTRFHIRPLIPRMLDSDRFYLLVLSEKQVHFYAGDAATLSEQPIPSMPKSMADALNLDETDRGSQVHAASSAMHGKQGAVFHGHGGIADTARRDLEAFVHRVAQAVDHHLQGKSQPLVIAADQSTACLFQEHTQYAQIVTAPLADNYDHTRLPALHSAAWTHMGPRLRTSQTLEWERLNDVLGTPRTAIGIHEVLTAARDGKIEALFIETQTPIWGSYDPQQRIATVHHECMPGDEDLAETLIQDTLTKRGKVAALETREHPQVDDRVVALLRY